MYEYKEIKNIQIEITEKCNSKCALCRRYLSNGDINPNLNNRELTINDIKKIFSDIDFIKQIEDISFCGNYGDPICNNDLIEILKFFKKHNENINLTINTNGSLRYKEFWIKLAELNVKIFFSIDGLKDTNHIYRQNTSFEKILENAKNFINAGGDASWDYIVFEHNEHQVEEAKQLSEKIGFSNFVIKKTSRLDGRGEEHSHLKKPKSKIYQNKASSKIDHENLSTYLNQKKIKCIFGNLDSIFLTAEGFITPCCWIGGLMNQTENKNFRIFKNKDKINSKVYPISKILEGSFFKEIKDSWKKETIEEGKLRTCSYICSVDNSTYKNQF